MVDIVTKGGKKLGRIDDSNGDSFIVDGKIVSLEDVYSDETLKAKFNESVKELNDSRTN